MSKTFFSKDDVVCDMLWTHPDAIKIHDETIRDKEFTEVYVTYEIFQYPKDKYCEEGNRQPAYIVTKRGSIDPKYYIYSKKSSAYKRLETEKEKWEKNVENFRTLLVIGKVARS